MKNFQLVHFEGFLFLGHEIGIIVPRRSGTFHACVSRYQEIQRTVKPVIRRSVFEGHDKKQVKCPVCLRRSRLKQESVKPLKRYRFNPNLYRVYVCFFLRPW